MKPKCDSVREWLGAFADGELEPGKAERVRQHLETCADCRQELDQILELGRLAKRVEHPLLADDYWDWHRTRVWRGIREHKRVPEPRYRPMFVWPKLAAAAAGFVIVLVVVLAGWRTLLMRPGRIRHVGPVGEVPGELRAAARPKVSPRSGATQPAARREAEPVAGSTPARAEGLSDELTPAPAAVRRGLEGGEAGYAAKGTGTMTGATARLGEERRVLAASETQDRTVSGPTLVESPALPDAHALDTGTVLLSVNTDSNGRVVNAAIRRSSGSARLDSIAVHQMRMSRFRAVVKNNRRVASSFEYQFRLPKKQTRSVKRDRPAADQTNPSERQYRRQSEQPDEKPDRHEATQPDKRSDKREGKRLDRQEVEQPDKRSDRQEVKQPDRQSDKQEGKHSDKREVRQPDKQSDKQEVRPPERQSDEQAENQSDSQPDSQPTRPAREKTRQ